MLNLNELKQRAKARATELAQLEEQKKALAEQAKAEKAEADEAIKLAAEELADLMRAAGDADGTVLRVVLLPEGQVKVEKAQPATSAGRVRGAQNPNRRPAPGSVITKNYHGTKIEVLVLEPHLGFEYDGKQYGSLSKVAQQVVGDQTGTYDQAINGWKFFGLA